MKKIKITLAALVAMVTMGTAVNAQTTFGIRAGVGMTGIYGKNTDAAENRFGYHFGINAEMPIGNDLYFQPNLLFANKGLKGTNEGVKVQQMYNYIEVPLNLLYKGEVGAGKVLVGVGPYIGYGIRAKTKVGSESESGSFKDANLKNLDYGANLLLGWEFSNKFSAQLNTGLGLANIAKDGGEFKPKNIGFGISLGYRF